MQARTFVIGRKIGQSMRSFNGKNLEYIHNLKTEVFILPARVYLISTRREIQPHANPFY